MKILYVITELGLGGAEILLVNLANRMVENGHDVEILALGSANAHVRTLDPRIKVSLLSMKKNLRGFIKAYHACWKLSRQKRWDVVHAHMFHANLVARLAAPLFRHARVISTAHSNNEGGAARMFAYRVTDFLSDINTNVSRGALDRYISHRFFSPSKSICVYNFVDTKHYHPDLVAREWMRREQGFNDRQFVVLNVGRLVHEKDQSLLLRAFAIALKEHLNLWLVLVGDGAERLALEDQAANLGIAQRVRFCGSRRDVAQWYNLADLFVLTSRVEGFGLVLAEAMASGCPAVTTDVGGCSEVVGDSGVVVPSGSVESVAEAIRRHVRLSNGQRAELAERQRARIVRLFDIDTIVRQWQSIYAEGLN